MDKVIFQKEWLTAISNLPAEQQLPAYNALLNYALNGIEPEPTDIIGTLIVGFAKPTIKKDNAEMEEYAEMKNRDRVNGAKGGRPKKEKNPLSEEKNPLFNSKKPLFEEKNPLFEKENPLFEEQPKEKESSSLSSPTPPILSPQEKEKENYDVVVAKENENPSSTPSSDFIPVGELEDHLLAETLWVDSMLYKFKLDREQLAVQLHTFCREWIERGDNVKTLKDAKRHADSLLNIRQREGTLADPPRWNRFLVDLMLPYVDELRYDLPITKAFGEHYMQNIGNGKPYFLGIPHFEEDIRQRMLNFQTTYNDEQPVESRSRSQSA